MGGKAIPSNIQKCTNFESDADFILLVEKDAAFQRLAEDRFYNRFPCIIITGKGQPDVATRQFLRKMQQDLKLQVLALVDADPYGLNIMSVYTRGSKNMSFDSSNLTTPGKKILTISLPFPPPPSLSRAQVNTAAGEDPRCPGLPRC